MSDHILERMIALNADGVDFFPIMPKADIGIPNMFIFKSYTKDEFANVKYYPKSDYMFWKIIDGKKQYIED